MASTMEARTLPIGDGEFAVLEAGAGGAPLLLVHGWTGSKEDFIDWMEPLADTGHHVVAPDHRGHGESHKPEDEGQYSLDILAADMLAIADLMAATTDPGPLDTEAYQRVCAERPGHRERGVEMTRVASSAMFAAMLLEMASTSSRLEALAALDVPTLVMVGDQDLPFIPASEALAATIPDARYELLPDAGHSPQFEAPDAWWTVLSSFLGELPAD